MSFGPWSKQLTRTKRERIEVLGREGFSTISHECKVRWHELIQEEADEIATGNYLILPR